MRPALLSACAIAVLAVLLGGTAGCTSAKSSASAAASPSAGAAKAGEAKAGAAEFVKPLPSPVPDVVARVNGQPIRLAQLVPIAKSELKHVRPAEPDVRKAEALRRALAQYVERELLVQEAIARGVTADQRSVDWAYDQARGEHKDDAEWAKFLAGEGTDPRSFKAELRIQGTIAVLLAREAQARGLSPDDARSVLLQELRAKARIELFL